MVAASNHVTESDNIEERIIAHVNRAARKGETRVGIFFRREETIVDMRETARLLIDKGFGVQTDSYYGNMLYVTWNEDPERDLVNESTIKILARVDDYRQLIGPFN